MKASSSAKRKRLDISGVLLLDKPAGLSSNDALIRAKRIVNAKKAGHTGTLDPFATGLLPICFGEATKFSQDLLDADKTYETVVYLGVKTETGDTEGAVLETKLSPLPSAEEIGRILPCFMGTIRQVPPMYSALKRDGKPLYEYARNGIELEREAREVTVHELVLLDYTPPRLRLCVTCSKGTYIRVLGEDIGEALGCFAHLESLRRTRVGTLEIGEAICLDDLENRFSSVQAPSELPLEPVDFLLSSFPAVMLDTVLAGRFVNGQRLSVVKERIATSVKPGRRRVYDAARGVFLGTAQLRGDGILAPERLVSLSRPPL